MILLRENLGLNSRFILLMAEATKKNAAPKKAAAKKRSTKKNKLGVKNSLVNNINAKKKKGASRSKNKSTVSKKAYKDMQNNWDK